MSSATVEEEGFARGAEIARQHDFMTVTIEVYINGQAHHAVALCGTRMKFMQN
jgi:hypothetical protein